MAVFRQGESNPQRRATDAIGIGQHPNVIPTATGGRDHRSNHSVVYCVVHRMYALFCREEAFPMVRGEANCWFR